MLNTQQRAAREAQTLSVIEAEQKELLANNAKLAELGSKAEAHLSAAAACALAMAEVLKGEGLHSMLNRRDLPGLTVRSMKQVNPALQEFFAWRLGVTVTSDFKVFQADRPLERVIAADTRFINDEANALKSRAQRGF